MDRAKARVDAAIAVAGFIGDPADRVGTEQVGFYLAHVAFDVPLSRIASAAGVGRSVIASACHAIEDRRDDEAFDAVIAVAEQSLRLLADRQWRLQKAEG